MSTSPDPREQKHHARYQRTKEAFQAGEYAKALELLKELPPDYLGAHPDIRAEVKSMKRNAQLGQTLARVGIFDAVRKRFRFSWTRFAAALAAAVSIALMAAGLVFVAAVALVSCRAPVTPTAAPIADVTTYTPAPPGGPTPTITEQAASETIKPPTQSVTESAVGLIEGEKTPSAQPVPTSLSGPPPETPTPEGPSPAALPAAPTAPQVTAATEDGITLTWQNNAGDQTKVVIKRDGQQVAELPPDSSSFADSGLKCGQSFTYAIVAVNAAGDSTPAELAAQTKECPPSSPTPTPTPVPSTLAGKIAVPVFDAKAGAYNIYVAHASNNWQPQLFFQSGSQPAFSRDGQQIILRSWRPAEQGFGQRLVLFPGLDIQSPSRRLMTENLEDAHPSLSRTGEIVFHSRRAGQPILVTLGTWTGAESDTANQRVLGLGENPDWLGERLVYYSGNPASGLYVANADGSQPQLILGVPASVAPAAAPDGERVAVALNRGGNWHIFSLSASQGEGSLAQLTREGADDMLPVWSPDGQSIAFVSNRGGTWAVWVMKADGTEQRKLFDMGGSIDGKVSIAPNMSIGWGEERLSWAP